MYLKIETILISILKYDIQLIFVRTKIRFKIRTCLEMQPESKPENEYTHWRHIWLVPAVTDDGV